MRKLTPICKKKLSQIDLIILKREKKEEIKDINGLKESQITITLMRI